MSDVLLECPIGRLECPYNCCQRNAHEKCLIQECLQIVRYLLWKQTTTHSIRNNNPMFGQQPFTYFNCTSQYIGQILSIFLEFSFSRGVRHFLGMLHPPCSCPRLLSTPRVEKARSQVERISSKSFRLRRRNGKCRLLSRPISSQCPVIWDGIGRCHVRGHATQDAGRGRPERNASLEAVSL